MAASPTSAGDPIGNAVRKAARFAASGVASAGRAVGRLPVGSVGVLFGTVAGGLGPRSAAEKLLAGSEGRTTLAGLLAARKAIEGRNKILARERRILSAGN